jgi:uncharacterized protein YkwD
MSPAPDRSDRRRRGGPAPPLLACLLGLSSVLVPTLAAPAKLAILASPSILAAPATLALATPPAEAAGLRRELLRLLDAPRTAAGAPPLHLSAALERAAQEHAAEVAASESPAEEGRSKQTMERRMAAAGYDAYQWVESLLSGTAPVDAAELIALLRHDDGAYRRLLDSALVDVGVGVAYSERQGETFVSILAATPQGEVFARETAGLRDLARVRADLVARINLLRRRTAAPQLTANYHLDVAAQRHAEDMLARSYFAHRSPDGSTVRERARAAGYEWAAIGENLAAGQRTIDQAVEDWMHSAGHRENILDQRFTDTGVGLAIGRDPRNGEYRVLWVQTFGSQR